MATIIVKTSDGTSAYCDAGKLVALDTGEPADTDMPTLPVSDGEWDNFTTAYGDPITAPGAQ